MTLTVEPPMDANGNLDIHNQEGGEIVLNFTFDVSGKTMVLETSTGIRINLTPGPTVNDQTLSYDQGTFEALLGQTASYAIIDETNATHDLIMEGEIKVRGF